MSVRGEKSHPEEAWRITPAALDAYIEVTAALPLPICIVDHKGFLHYTNQQFSSLVNITLTADFPFVGRFLFGESIVKLRAILDLLIESEDNTTYMFECTWADSLVKTPAANREFIWTISGQRSSRAFTICGRPLKSTDISEFFTLPEDTTRLENMVKVLKYQHKMRERDILSKTGDLDKSILICEVTRQWGFIARLAPRKYKLKKADLRDSFSEGIWGYSSPDLAAHKIIESALREAIAESSTHEYL